MAEVCLSNGEQLELERLCPRNLSLEKVNTSGGRCGDHGGGLVQKLGGDSVHECLHQD